MILRQEPLHFRLLTHHRYVKRVNIGRQPAFVFRVSAEGALLAGVLRLGPTNDESVGAEVATVRQLEHLPRNERSRFIHDEDAALLIEALQRLLEPCSDAG